MADEGLIREALAEAERHRQHSAKRVRMVRWSDLEKELAQRTLDALGDGKVVDE